jgi:hypothetical protein
MEPQRYYRKKGELQTELQKRKIDITVITETKNKN